MTPAAISRIKNKSMGQPSWLFNSIAITLTDNQQRRQAAHAQTCSGRGSAGGVAQVPDGGRGQKENGRGQGAEAKRVHPPACACTDGEGEGEWGRGPSFRSGSGVRPSPQPRPGYGR